jgi:hypothetical protein
LYTSATPNGQKVSILLEELGVTAVGKVDKKALRGTYWQGRRRAVN